MRHGLAPRQRRDLESIAAGCGEDGARQGRKEDLVSRLGECLLRSGHVRVEECLGGPLLAPRLTREMLEILEGLDWKTATSAGHREVGRSSGASFVMGTTLGALGSNGYASVARVAARRGANRDVVKATYTSQAAQLRRLWALCREAVGPGYRFTSVQVNRDFAGKPHVDKNDVGHQYALSLGAFEGGRLVVATSDPLRFRSLDTRNRVTRCDGRHPHWVTPHSGGTRYSLIMYRVEGRAARRGDNLEGGRCRLVGAESALPRSSSNGAV